MQRHPESMIRLVFQSLATTEYSHQGNLNLGSFKDHIRFDGSRQISSKEILDVIVTGNSTIVCTNADTNSPMANPAGIYCNIKSVGQPITNQEFWRKNHKPGTGISNDRTVLEENLSFE
ncbi:MAG: hypothetical protein IPI30_06195 [Saprospiraceae bacterium]|nr:hypothetical protein [Candidatus Vicinibacter affinis]